MNIWWDKVQTDYHIRFVVLDRTPMIKEEHRVQTELFLYMIAKTLHLFTEETGIPLSPGRWYAEEDQWKEVKENWFIPFKEVDIRPITTPLRDVELELLNDYRGRTPQTTKKSSVETKPVVK